MKKEIILKNVKGTYDYMPEEQKIRDYIKDTLRKVFEEYGYMPLETPILSHYELLAGKYDETNDLLNEIYKLSDQGERKLGLRYDLTVPFARCIASTKDLRLPFKRYEIGKVFRDGPVKLGRDREFLQCDVDVVGLSGELIEAELITLWLKGYKELGIDVYVKYNSRNLIRGLIKEQGINDEEVITSVVTIIDKLDKMTKEELLDELEKKDITRTQGENILKYFEYSLEELNEYFLNTENILIKKGLEEVNSLKDILTKLGVGENVMFTSSLARGQDYYTGNVFEVYAKNSFITCSLGGGGRYDNMITDFISNGEIYPAVGVSFGLSSIYEILKQRDEFKNKSLIDIFVIPMSTEVESLALSNELRELGFNVELEMKNKKIKKSFDYANRENIPYVIVYGSDEIENGIFKVKNMTTGEEYLVKRQDLNKLFEIIK